MRKSGVDQARIGFRMRQFVRDVREPGAARLKFADQRQRLLDGLVHRMRHVAQRVQHQVVQTGEQRLWRIPGATLKSVR